MTTDTSLSAPPKMVRWKVTAAKWAFIIPAVLYILLFFLYPVISNAVMGFQESTTTSMYTGETPWVQWKNYLAILALPEFPTVLRNTFLFTFGSIAGQFVIGLSLAVFFKKSFPLSKTLRALLLVPWLLPMIVSSALWRSIMDQDSGPLNEALQALGLINQGIPWLVSVDVALISVVIVNIWIGIPFNMALLYGGLEEIPEELYEAASIDGAGRWRTFRAVTFPLLRPTMNVVLLLGVIYTLRSLDVILGLTRGGPANATQTLPTLSYSLSFQQYDFGMGAAASNILILISLLFAVIYLRVSRKSNLD